MKIGVMGAGNGGCAAAVDLSLRGFDVTLCSGRYPERLQEIHKRGGLEYSGAIGEGFARVNTSFNPLETAKNTSLIMVATPATAHEFYARAISEAITSESCILLNPGSTGGALHFSKILMETNTPRPKGVCETHTLTYACRLQECCHVRIYNVAPQILVSNFPSATQDSVIQKVREAYPSLMEAKNVLETGLANINAIMHPAAMIMNAGQIERTLGDFYFYHEGTTEGVARIIEAVDEERLRIAKAFGIPERTYVECFKLAGYTNNSDISIRQAIVSSVPDRYIRSPSTLNHRYLLEDVAYGLVPMAYLARVSKEETPIIDSLIHIAGRLNGVNHWTEGLTLDKIGLANSDINSINEILSLGFAR